MALAPFALDRRPVPGVCSRKRNRTVKLNLDSLLTEIESYLETRGAVVFHSHPRAADASAPVYWDTERHPDYKQFLAAAEAAGARLVTIHAREFNDDILDDARSEEHT